MTSNSTQKFKQSKNITIGLLSGCLIGGVGISVYFAAILKDRNKAIISSLTTFLVVSMLKILYLYFAHKQKELEEQTRKLDISNTEDDFQEDNKNPSINNETSSGSLPHSSTDQRLGNSKMAEKPLPTEGGKNKIESPITTNTKEISDKTNNPLISKQESRSFPGPFKTLKIPYTNNINDTKLDETNIQLNGMQKTLSSSDTTISQKSQSSYLPGTNTTKVYELKLNSEKGNPISIESTTLANIQEKPLGGLFMLYDSKENTLNILHKSDKGQNRLAINFNTPNQKEFQHILNNYLKTVPKEQYSFETILEYIINQHYSNATPADEIAKRLIENSNKNDNFTPAVDIDNLPPSSTPSSGYATPSSTPSF